jgi:23S rRNA G2445 N2-methylase RlmL
LTHQEFPNMTFRRTNITACPFDNLHIRNILDRVINEINYQNKGKVLMCDPFARESFTNHLQGCITNDLNTEFNTNYNLEFKDFATEMKDLEHEFDLVFFDPPYSLRQLKDNYDGIGKNLELWQTHNMWKEGKDTLSKLVKPGGYVVSLGWTTSGFGKKRGFVKKEIHVMEQVAREDRYALLITVEQKVQTSLLDY